MSELLTAEELIIQKQCQYCHYYNARQGCIYDKPERVIPECAVFETMVAKWKPYFESLMAQRIAEAVASERERIFTFIDTLNYPCSKANKDTCNYCLFQPSSCPEWQQLKGKE